MSELQIFNHPKFGKVRTIEEDNKVLFCGNDVATALGYKSPKDAVTAHCKGAVIRRLPTNGGGQDAKFIPEGDIYRMAAKSELPGAKEFESWIFDEVLPSIRKHGGYISGQESMSDEDLLAKALLVAQSKIAERDRLLKDKQGQIERMRPKEIFADAVAASHTTILVGEMAKLLSQNGIRIGQNRLFSWLRNNGYLIKRKGADWNMPTQRAMEQGLFVVKESTISNPDGSVRINKTAKVTGKGQQYFINRFLASIK